MPVVGPAPQDVQARRKKAQAKAKKEAAKAAKEKFTAINDDDLVNQIVSNAKAGDPTAGSTVTYGPTGAAPASPLTNKPTGQQITGTGISAGFTATDYQADFVGNPNQGIVPRVTMEPDPKTGKLYVVERDQYNVPSQIAIMGDPNNPGAYIKTDRSTAVQNIIAEYKAKPNGIAELKQMLWERGALSGPAGKQSIAGKNSIDNTLGRALLAYVDEVTTTNFNNSGERNFKSFGAALSDKISYAGTKTSTAINLTPKDIAKSDITSFVSEYLGRGATAAEVKNYQESLDAFERSHPTRATVTTDALGTERSRVQVAGASEQDKMALKVAVVYKALQQKGIDPEQLSQNGGIIGQSINVLKEFSSKYGVQMDDRGALDNIVGMLKAGGTIDSNSIKATEEKIKAIAKVKYKNLASAIDQGATPKDIADQFQYTKNKVLETSNLTDMFDPDIQKALHNDGKAGIMSDTDWMFLLKNKEEWRYTQNAREEAAKWVNTIKEKWGLA